MTTAGLATFYLLAINLATYVAFFWDKRQAILQGWRVSERTLLTLAFAGGSPLAKLAQHAMRHKTRKQPFGHMLNSIILVQAAVGVMLLVPPLRDGAARTVSIAAAALVPARAPSEPARRMPHRFGPGTDLRP
jgi:uncharacterized membrane protein YsdA (DUF1294 family)